MATRPPLEAMRRATALPSPEAPPVMTARASAIFIECPSFYSVALAPKANARSHSEDAVALGFRRGAVRSYMKREAEHAAGVERVDDAIVPQARGGVIGMALGFVLVADAFH